MAPRTHKDFMEPVAAILLVLALLAGTLYLLKRRGGFVLSSSRQAAAGARRLQVVERVTLGPQQVLHLVRAGNGWVLVATTPSSCQLLPWQAIDDAGERV